MKDNERKLIYKAREALYREMREDYLYKLFEPGNGVAEVMYCFITALHCIELALGDFSAPRCEPDPYDFHPSEYYTSTEQWKEQDK